MLNVYISGLVHPVRSADQIPLISDLANLLKKIRLILFWGLRFQDPLVMTFTVDILLKTVTIRGIVSRQYELLDSPCKLQIRCCVRQTISGHITRDDFQFFTLLLLLLSFSPYKIAINHLVA